MHDTAARSPDLVATQRSVLAPDVVTRSSPSLLRSSVPPLLPAASSRADRSCAAPPLTCPSLLVLTREWDQVGGTLFAPDLVPRPTPPSVFAGQRGRSAGPPLEGGPAWTPAPPRDLTWAPKPPNANRRVGGRELLGEVLVILAAGGVGRHRGEDQRDARDRRHCPGRHSWEAPVQRGRRAAGRHRHVRAQGPSNGARAGCS